MLRPAAFVLALLLADVAGARSDGSPPASEERAVLETDARQRDAVASVDLAGIREIAHPNLRVNAPNNRILTREDLVRMVESGEIRNEVFERVPETVTVTGDVAVVMGRETVLPGENSEQARMYGAGRRLERRYTNVYLRTDGVWKHLARHANIVPPQAPTG
jgi:hypothetical protein